MNVATVSRNDTTTMVLQDGNVEEMSLLVGVNPAESEEIIQLILDIRKRGITQMVIEHNMRVVMGISDHVTVLDYGEKIAEGTPAEIGCNPDVISAYLGTSA